MASSNAGNNKNNAFLHCQFCNSLILREKLAKFVEQQHTLPLIHQKNTRQANEEAESERLDGFWMVEDMFTFENIGFSNTVDGCKFLVCADCDMGPVGYHDLETKVNYIAQQRVCSTGSKNNDTAPNSTRDKHIEEPS